MSDQVAESAPRSAYESRSEQPRLSRVSTTASRTRPDWQSLVGLGAAIFLSLALLGAIWYLARPLALLVLGFAIAAALSSPVKWLSRWLPRTAAIIVVHLFMIVLLVGLGWIITPTLVTQVQELSDALPETLAWVQQRVEQTDLLNLDAIINQALSSLSDLSSWALGLPMMLSNALLDVLLVFFLSLYSLMAAPAAYRFIQSFAPESQHDKVDRVLDEIIEAMGGYLRGVFITGTFVGVLTYAGLRLIGVPYPAVLGVLAGILEVIPVIGTTISMVSSTGVALTQSASTALITFGFMAAVQLVEGNILFPNIVSRQTHSSPLLSIFAFFAGISVGGILGGLIGVPLAVALRVIVVEVVAPALRRWTHTRAVERSAA